MNRSAILALSAFASAFVAAPPARAQDLVNFDIAPQPLDSALIAFALQAHVSISLPPAGLGQLRTSGLRGAHRPDEALALLLKGSGYAFEPAGPAAFRVVFAKKTSLPDATPSQPQPPDVVIVSARAYVTEADLPRDVTRVGPETLSGGGIASDADLASVVSGLSFTNLGPGRDKVLLRGLSDGAITGRTQSLVGLYFDTTRITYAAPDPDLQLVDMRSVEVLRGPQGALYGAGAIAGIMRLETNPPDLAAWSGSARLSAEQTEGGEPGGNAELVANIPVLPGVLGLRGVFYNDQGGGWLDNTTTGKRNTNGSRRAGLRLSALWALDDDWSISLTGIGQGIDNKDSQYFVRTPQGPRRTAAMAELNDNEFSMVNITVKGETAWGSLTSSTSSLRHQYGSRFDATNAIPALPAPPGLNQPIDEQESLVILVHETSLASRSDSPIPWFVGLFYSNGDTRRDVALRNGIGGVWNGLDYQEQRADDIHEAALFGEVTIPLGSSVSLSGGLRLFQSSLNAKSTVSEPVLGLDGTSGQKFSLSGGAPDVRLFYHPSRDMLFFVSAAKGYRSPGFNSGGPLGVPFSDVTQPFARYGGDHIWTYEIGTRLQLFDDDLELRITAFDSDWHGVQTDELIANGFTYTGNAGDARARGLDIDARYEVFPGLLVRAQALTIEPEISRRVPSFPLATDGGLPGSPEYSGALSIEYNTALSIGGAALPFSAQIRANYVGISNLGFGASDRIGDYIDADVRVGVSWDNWQVQAYVENFTNAEGSTYSFGNPYMRGQNPVTPLRPRTAGLSIRREF